MRLTKASCAEELKDPVWAPKLSLIQVDHVKSDRSSVFGPFRLDELSSTSAGSSSMSIRGNHEPFSAWGIELNWAEGAEIGRPFAEYFRVAQGRAEIAGVGKVVSTTAYLLKHVHIL